MNRKEKIAIYTDQIAELIENRVTIGSDEFQQWKINVERLLSSKYGRNSYEYQKFLEINFAADFSVINNKTSGNFFDLINEKAVQGCKKGLEESKQLLTIFQEDFIEENDVKCEGKPKELSKIFIVHGHDGELKQSVARIVEKQGIKAIILSEQVNHGQTIIEKIETNSNVGGAICLFTKDDIGKEKREKQGQPRARQNVVLETGYFMGKLGRDHVVILADNGIELPSDLSGVVYSNRDNWQVELLKELKAMGYAIDFNILF